MSGIYRRLRLMGAKMDCNNLSDVLLTMLDAQDILHLDELDRGEMPQMGDVADNGRRLEYGKRTKRKKRYDPDTLPEQVKIHFTDYDASTTDATEKSYGEKADDYLRYLEERARKEADDGT